MQEYKEIYLIMMRAAEKAIRILIEAQEKCEELYMGAEEKSPVQPPAGGAGESKGAG